MNLSVNKIVNMVIAGVLLYGWAHFSMSWAYVAEFGMLWGLGAVAAIGLVDRPSTPDIAGWIAPTVKSWLPVGIALLVATLVADLIAYGVEQWPFERWGEPVAAILVSSLLASLTFSALNNSR